MKLSPTTGLHAKNPNHKAVLMQTFKADGGSGWSGRDRAASVASVKAEASRETITSKDEDMKLDK